MPVLHPKQALNQYAQQKLDAMKILITGSGGMLGQALSPCLESRGHTIFSYPKEKLDVTNFSQVTSTLSSVKGLDLVIHCAAYTKVDQAESESALAFSINGYGSENLAVSCRKFDIPMLYISSDYVFDGEQKSPTQPGIFQTLFQFTASLNLLVKYRSNAI